ncbi:hypothetical protein GJ496_001486 [Pomphorhynchus laevis]|nr:hypothetical protein GJ496_001486 [Pomphorhynchus laevis]
MVLLNVTDVDTTWNIFKRTTIKHASNVIGHTKEGRRYIDKSFWQWTDEVRARSYSNTKPAKIFKFQCCSYVGSCQGNYLFNFCTIRFAESPDSLLFLKLPLLYTIQNNLLFIALSNLNAVVYQMTYQFKILTTAMFTVLLLKRKLNRRKWISLVVLMIGVCCIQLNEVTTASKLNQTTNSLTGLLCVMIANFTSGFSGVYFEKMLKSNVSSIWMQNLFLACFSAAFGLMNCMIFDYREIAVFGFFRGYNYIVCLVILLQALGGLIVAVVIKYTDNIAKAFASSLSIIISAVVSYLLLNDLTLSLFFFVGSVLVLASTFYYNYDSKPTETTRYRDVCCDRQCSV